MLSNYTAKYTKISSGYMGQFVEWPEVITEGENFRRLPGNAQGRSTRNNIGL